MAAEHPFAAHLRVIGKGPHLSRPLTRAEARAAMGMILAGAVEPAQLGAFLLLLRYRGETAEELAGFVEAAHDALRPRWPTLVADLDWPSYADRHRQQPWYVLAALLLAENGVRVLMHGIEGEADGYAPTRPALRRLGIAICDDSPTAMAALAGDNIAYVGLDRLCPSLDALFALRPMLGMRTVVNTLARALNPARASYQLQGVFHPPYRQLHQQAAALLAQPNAAIFKGGGGEAQRNPLKPCRVALVRDGVPSEEEWPALLPEDAYQFRGEGADPAAIAALWRGEIERPAPVAAITGTVAIALTLTGKATDQASAQALAEEMWRCRSRRAFAAAAAE